jgi:predicted TIM-barrel fold metal-dependent hydrolase
MESQVNLVYDSLTHVTPDGNWFDTGIDASEYRLLRELEKSNVKKAVVVALAGFISNEYVLDLCKRHNDVLIPGASFNPILYNSPDKVKQEFRAQLYGTPYQVLKLHPRLNGYDPLDARCLALLDELASWEKPMKVWLDTLFYFQKGSLQKPPVDTVHEIINRYPTITFVILHSGGSWMLQMTEALRDCPNAFFDISYILVKYAESSLWMDMMFLLQQFDLRVVFGSDFPEISIELALNYLDQLCMDMPLQIKENVLGKNLEAILSGN